MGFIRWTIGVIIAITTAGFAVKNRHTIELFWSPLHPSTELPLYLAALGLMAFGFTLGCLMVWLNAEPVRRTRRHQKKEIKKLKKELSTINESKETNAPASEFFPALPARHKSSK